MMPQSKIDQSSAEFVEKSPSAKGNTGQATVTNTQGLEPASSGLSRVREAAKQDSKLQFNNLLHHVNIGLLRQSYLENDPYTGAGERRSFQHTFTINHLPSVMTSGFLTVLC